VKISWHTGKELLAKKWEKMGVAEGDILFIVLVENEIIERLMAAFEVGGEIHTAGVRLEG
jgi:hypothetical protein